MLEFVTGVRYAKSRKKSQDAYQGENLLKDYGEAD